MITPAGKKRIGNTVATSLATHIGIGVSSSDTDSLGFQVYSEPIELSVYNELNGEITFTCSVPNENEIEISEISLCSEGSEDNDEYVLCDFTPELEDWTGTLISADSSRVKIGTHALAVSGVLGEGRNSEQTPISVSDSRPTDVISVVGTIPANTQLTLIFFSTETDYLSHTFVPDSNDTYEHFNFNLAEMVPTGSPSFDATNVLSIVSDNESTIDAVAVRRATSEFGVMAKESVTPFRSEAGEVTEIEFKMVIN